MTRRGGTLALAVIAGLLLFGLAWGLLAWAATLVAVILLAGLAGDLITSNRVRAALIMPAGLAGVDFSLLVVGWFGVPALLRVAGVPVLWAIAGATAAIGASSVVASR